MFGGILLARGFFLELEVEATKMFERAREMGVGASWRCEVFN